MQIVEQQVFNHILEYSSEQRLSAIKTSINKNNIKIEKELLVLKTELDIFEEKLSQIKQKKEKYLDSLVNNEFKATERKLINDKIEEFTLEEKQIKADIYRQQFDISGKTDLVQSIDEFKEEIIFFKLNRELMTNDELIKWLKRNIEKINYTEKEIIIDYKLLKFDRINPV